MTDEQFSRRNCQICGDRGKILKFAEVAQVHDFCEYRDAREKFTASVMYNAVETPLVANKNDKHITGWHINNILNFGEGLM